jgi:hypothetical protein
MEAQHKPFVTNDLSFASYLVMNGLVLVKASKLGNSFQFIFMYDEKIENLKIAYVNSESSKFDDAVRKVKKILFSNKE